MKRRQFILSLAGTAAVGWTGWKLSGLAGRGAATGGALTSGGTVRVSRQTRALGTQVNLTVYHRAAAPANAAIDQAFAQLAQVEQVMSLYRADSQICELNRQGHLDNPHPWLVEVLEAATALSRQTAGAFDITVQPLMRLHLEAAAAGATPDPEALRAALQTVDWRRVAIAPDRIELGGAGTAITLNGIAQGFAADVIGRVLADHGITSALIDTGEIGALGAPAPRDQWSIGIKHPRNPDDFLGVARLAGRCLATSGDYETRFSEDFTSHHLLDPRTGRSPAELSSVSVAAPAALTADALSTAAFLLGLERGKHLIESTEGADALFVTKSGHTVATAGFPLA